MMVKSEEFNCLKKKDNGSIKLGQVLHILCRE